jgi:hypothetical protein
VILNSWMHGRKEALRIFGPPETRRIVDALLTQVYDKDWQWRSMGEPAFGGWKPVEAKDIEPGAVIEDSHWKATAYRVRHGDGLGFPPAFLQRWMCYGFRFEAHGKVVAISGDTVDCEGLAQLAHGADLLVHCCYAASAEIENEHFRRVVQHTLAAGDAVGKIAACAGAKMLALTIIGRAATNAICKSLRRKWHAISRAGWSWARTSLRSRSEACGRRTARPQVCRSLIKPTKLRTSRRGQSMAATSVCAARRLCAPAEDREAACASWSVGSK